MTPTPVTVLCWSPKAGAGCTTFAATLAHHLANTYAPAWLIDASPQGDAAALVGIAHTADDGHPQTVAPNLQLVRALDPDSLDYCARPLAVVIDVGAGRDALETWVAPTRTAIGIMQARYLDLRATTCDPLAAHALGMSAGLIVNEHAGAALGTRDVTNVTGARVLASLVRNETTARAIDAGHMLARTPRPLALAVSATVRALGIGDTVSDARRTA